MSSEANAVVVYRARNLVNGKTYIGYTARGLARRERAHRVSANIGRGNLLQAAMRKYGHENIVFEVMYDFDGDEDLAKLYEQEAIEKYKPEYNLSRGGEGGSLHASSKKKIGDANRGRKRTPEQIARQRAALAKSETKAKMSASQKRRIFPPTGPMSEEQKAKISATRKGQPSWWTGKTHSETTRQKLAARPRRDASEEVRAKMRVAHLKRWSNPTDAMRAAALIGARSASEANKRPVKCLTDGRVFDSYSEAEHFYGLPVASVSQALRRKSKTVRGLLFERVSQEPRS